VEFSFDDVAISLAIKSMLVPFGNKNTSDKLWAKKEKIMQENGLNINSKLCAYSTDPPLPWNFISLLRVVFATEEEITENKYLNIYDDVMISKQNETLVGQFLVHTCEGMLNKYPTIASEDEDLLRKTTLEVGKCAIMLRKEEKRLLVHVVNYAKGLSQINS